jgi:hypothetical protein
MDHLQVVKDPAFPPIEVPYLCTEEYDGLEWESYPERQGWHMNHLVNADFSGKPTKETAAMLQTWLYFGVLQETLRITIDMKDWVCENERGQRVINSTSLPQRLEDWENSVLSLPKESAQKRMVATVLCLEKATEMVNIAFVHDERWPLCPEVTLSIKVLLDALTLMDTILAYHPENFKKHIMREWYPDHLLKSRLSGPSWCPNEVARVETLATSVTYVATNIKRPHIWKDHSSCTKEACIAYNINEDEYETKHYKDACDCPFNGPDEQEIAKILQSNGIPLISLSFINSDFQLEVVRFEPGMSFVAISHVWSDGLGNVKKNSLPSCQLLKLLATINALNKNQDQVLDLTKPMRFWMDTLCVPHDDVLKKMAILRMDQTYKSAEAVLVLDSELQKVSTDISLDEILVRIICSGWMRRIWTLQEGMLAPKLWVSFEDGFESLTSIMEASNSLAFRFKTVVTSALSAFWPMSHQVMDGMEKSHRFAAVWDAFQWRSTSKAKDAITVFSIIMGLPLDKTLSGTIEERMVQFFSQQLELPKSILFCNLGSRLIKNGYRWAPSSLVGRRNLIGDRSPARRDGAGLTASYFSFVFSPKANLKSNFFIKEYGKPTMISVDYDGEEGSWTELAPHPNARYGVIAIKPIFPGAASAVYGVLVLVLREERGIYFSRYLGNVACSRSTAVFHHYLPWAEPGEKERVIQEKPWLNELIVEAENEEEWLRWCVG